MSIIRSDDYINLSPEDQDLLDEGLPLFFLPPLAVDGSDTSDYIDDYLREYGDFSAEDYFSGIDYSQLEEDIRTGTDDSLIFGYAGKPGGPEMQGEELLQGRPVNIVKRNEAGEQIGIISGVRIGYGENSRVVTLDELARINKIRRQSGQDAIDVALPGFVPEFVDESGAPVDNSSNTTDASSNTNTTTSTDATTSTDSSSVDSATGEGIDLTGTTTGGGGMMEFPKGSGVFVPEGMLEQAKILMQQGVGIRNLANALGLESRNQQDVVGPVNMTDAELNGLTDEGLDPNFTGEFDGQQYENGMLVSSGGTTQTGSSTATGGTSDASSTATGGTSDASSTSEIGDTTLIGGDTTVSTGATTLTGGDSTLTGGDLYGGDVSTGDTSLTTGATTLTGGAVTTGPVTTDVTTAGGAGGAGGSVNISFGDGTGGQGVTPEQALEFFTQLSTIPAFETGKALESRRSPRNISDSNRISSSGYIIYSVYAGVRSRCFSPTSRDCT
jgi:hypothetical protein